MCGLVGMAGEITVKEERAMKTLLTLDALRGIDSTGIAVIPRHNGVVKMAKEVGNPYNLFETKPWDRAMLGQQRAIIGHNRYATQGATTRRNAHPFEFDGLVGAHNGTLRNKWKLDDNKDFDVDSENLYHHMDKHGVRHALDIIEGAWALTWWDKYDESINFLRNSERPLFLARSKDAKVLFWASEAWMLRVACSREGIDISDAILLEVDMMHSFPISKVGFIDKPTLTPMAAKSAPIVYDKWEKQPPKELAAAVKPNLSVVPTNTGSQSTTESTPKERKPTLTLSKDLLNEGDQKNPRVAPLSANERAARSWPLSVKQQTTSGLKPGYANSRNASLEIVGYGTDSFGAAFYRLTDVESPEVNVRLYYTAHPHTARSPIGTKITADIGDVRQTPIEGTFYKVVSSSVKLVKDEKPKYSVPETYKDSKGNLVDFNTWMNKHSSCVWCADSVMPVQEHRFTPNGELICGSCAVSTDIKSMYSWE